MSLAATRADVNAFESYLTYYLYCDAPGLRNSFIIKESTHMVDGIGGGTWEGSILMSKLVEAVNVDSGHRIIELGCGAGLSGIVAAIRGSKTEISDRVVDLAAENIAYCRNQLETEPQGLHDKNGVPSKEETKFDIRAYELAWGLDDHMENRIDYPDLILGSEITCLRKQQPNLMRTIDKLTGPRTVVLLSFDDLPMPISGKNESDRENSDFTGSKCAVNTVSLYEREFDDRMSAAGFNRTVVCTAAVDWVKENVAEGNGSIVSTLNSTEGMGNPVQFEPTAVHASFSCVTGTSRKTSTDTKKLKKSHAVVHDITNQHYNNLDSVSFPCLLDTTCNKNGPYGKLPLYPDLCDEAAHLFQHLHQPLLVTSHHVHHITAYYRPPAVSTCTRCHKSYIIVLKRDKIRRSKLEDQSGESAAVVDDCGFCD